MQPITATVNLGQEVPLKGTGKMLRILNVFPLVQIQVKAGGQTVDALPGQTIVFPESISAGTIAAPSAANIEGLTTLQVVYLLGDNLTGVNPTTEPGSSIVSVDWVTLVASATINLFGQVTVRGTLYRRRKITLANITGSGVPGVNTAAIAYLQTFYSRNMSNTVMTKNGVVWSSQGGSGFNGGIFPLLPATTTALTQVKIDTDDVVAIGATSSPVDVSMIEEWVPVLT